MQVTLGIGVGGGGQEICIFNEPWRNSDVGDPWAIFGKS